MVTIGFQTRPFFFDYKGCCPTGRTSVSPLGTAIVLTDEAVTRREPARQTAWLLITELTARHLQAAAVVFCYSIFIFLLTLVKNLRVWKKNAS